MVRLNYFRKAETDDELSPLLDSSKSRRKTPLTSTFDQASIFRQYFAAFAITIGGIVTGTCLGWTSPTEYLLTKGNEYGFPISAAEFSWIASLWGIGGFCAAPLVGWSSARFGRRNTALLLIIPVVAGWTTIIWSGSVVMICIGRFLTGVAGVHFPSVVPLYVNEFSESHIRGTLGMFFQLQINIGILFTYILGSFVSVYWLSVVCALIPIFYGAIMLLIPESPIYYLKTGRREDARRSLQWFRGNNFNIEPELYIMQQSIEAIEREELSMLKAFSTKAAKRGLLLGLGIVAFQQLSGINSIVFYANSIFTEAGAYLPANIEATIVGTIGVISNLASTLVIDRMGRRPLLLLSDIFMALTTFLLGLYFYLKLKTSYDVTPINWLPILSVCVFIVTFNLGFGPIPCMFMSEVFPRQITEYSCALGSMINAMFVFLVTKFFSNFNMWIGLYGSFWIFTVFCIIGTFFIYCLVPETKKKTLEEVQFEIGRGRQ